MRSRAIRRLLYQEWIADQCLQGMTAIYSLAREENTARLIDTCEGGKVFGYLRSSLGLWEIVTVDRFGSSGCHRTWRRREGMSYTEGEKEEMDQEGKRMHL